MVAVVTAVEVLKLGPILIARHGRQLLVNAFV
jgi:hypothetical protein